MLNNFKFFLSVSLLLCFWTLTGAQHVDLIKRSGGDEGQPSPRDHARGHVHGSVQPTPAYPAHWPAQGNGYVQPGSAYPAHPHANGHEHVQQNAAQFNQPQPAGSRADRMAYQAGRIYNNPTVAVARKGVKGVLKFASRPVTDRMDEKTKSNLRGTFSNFGHNLAHASPSIEKFTGHFKTGKEAKAKEYSDKLEGQGFVPSDMMKGSHGSSHGHQ